MIIASIFNIAFQAIWANKLRSGLTLLGVMIGVMSVMTIISSLEGMSDSIEKDLSSLGPTTFIVQRIGVITSEKMYFDKIKRKPLSMDAVDLLRESCSLVETLAPRAYSNGTVKYRDQSLRNVSIRAAPSNIIDIVDIRVSQGRFHSRDEDLHNRNVCFIGDQIRETLFEGLDPIGKSIKINSKKYTIIGVNIKKGSTFGNNPDNFVFIPFSAYVKQFGEPKFNLAIFLKAKSVEVLDDAMDQARMVLRAQRHVPFNKGDDFDILTADSILELLNSITKIFRMGLVGISSISLVVGGIVVMNIMMVSVSERTREIGIRKSLGAKGKHILLQFMFESLLLTFTGGLVGILVGFLIAQYLMGLIDMQISPSMFAIFSGLIISSGTGLIFGIYPAMRAAKLDPIKALSYE